MVPQGSVVFNAHQINELTARINAVQLSVDLQPLVDEAMQSLTGVKAAINAEMAQLAPILALLSAPGADLSKLATWISTYISSVLTAQYQPYINYATQLAQMTAAVAGLVGAIENKAAHLSVTVNIPTF